MFSKARIREKLGQPRQSLTNKHLHVTLRPESLPRHLHTGARVATLPTDPLPTDSSSVPLRCGSDDAVVRATRGTRDA